MAVNLLHSSSLLDAVFENMPVAVYYANVVILRDYLREFGVLCGKLAVLIYRALIYL